MPKMTLPNGTVISELTTEELSDLLKTLGWAAKAERNSTSGPKPHSPARSNSTQPNEWTAPAVRLTVTRWSKLSGAPKTILKALADANGESLGSKKLCEAANIAPRGLGPAIGLIERLAKKTGAPSPLQKQHQRKGNKRSVLVSLSPDFIAVFRKEGLERYFQ